MRYQDFTAVGVATKAKFDGGLVSTEVEPKRIEAILICVEKYAANHIEGWIGSNKIMDLYDYVLDTFDSAAAGTTYPSGTKMGRVPIGEDIPVGQTFKIGIRCGGTDTDIYGAYQYTIRAS